MSRVYRAWGHYTVLVEAPDYKIKILNLLPGQCISKQRHFNRDESWQILEGEGIVYLFDTNLAPEFSMVVNNSLNASLFIPKYKWHQLINTSITTNLVILELQRGLCYEEDIERS